MNQKNGKGLEEAVKDADRVMREGLALKVEDALKLRRANGKKRVPKREKRK